MCVLSCAFFALSAFLVRYELELLFLLILYLFHISCYLLWYLCFRLHSLWWSMCSGFLPKYFSHLSRHDLVLVYTIYILSLMISFIIIIISRYKWYISLYILIGNDKRYFTEGPLCPAYARTAVACWWTQIMRYIQSSIIFASTTQGIYTFHIYTYIFTIIYDSSIQTSISNSILC